MFHLRQPPKVSVVQEKTPRGTRGVLAQVPLGPAACFAAFDDLLTLTMWTPDGDERHETLPVSGRCQERAQCDINLSPSPHLEHYLMLHAWSEKHNSFLRPLTKKGFKEERVTTIELYDIGKPHDPGIQQEPWLIEAGPHTGRVHFIMTEPSNGHVVLTVIERE